MKTDVRFRSDRFPPYEGEEDQINPGRWGKRLAEYLVEKLKEVGIETGEIIPEDWGWYIPIKNESFRLGLCCSNLDGEDDGFLCFTHPNRPKIWKGFKKIDTSESIHRLANAIDHILRSDPDIRNICWLTDGEIGS